MEKDSPQCVKCSVLRCSAQEKNKKVPASCPTEKYADLAGAVAEKYRLPENQAINMGWFGVISKVLDPEKQKEKWSWTRLDEIIEYAKVRRMTRLGIATCYGLMVESRTLSDILEHNGFDVVSVSCLCGEMKPQDIGMPGNITCNPILQAEVLNHEKTELNIMVGLCIGHDILFLRHAKAETTPLVVKDRSLGHNPVAALYQSQGFFKDRFFGKK
jgi:uncharacterized metal-binding protein